MIDIDTFLNDAWIYKYYIIGGLICLVIIILFICIIALKKEINNTKIIKKNGLKNNILTWKFAHTFMRHNYKSDNRLHRAKFYTRNVILCLLLIAFGFYCYENFGIIKLYLDYLKYAYTAGIIFEYVLVFLVINTKILKNYNNINDEKTCILIPFGGSTLEDRLSYIGDTLKRASMLVDSKSVYLLHNGAELVPKIYDKIKKICDDLDVTYVYVPQPNKSYAIYYAAKNLCSGFEQCLIIDDDVPLREDTYIPNMKTTVGAYLITAYIDDNMSFYQKFLARLQGTEYLFSGMTKIVQSRWNLSASALSHHGAVGLWKIKQLVEIMEKHDSIFHGEDLMMGVLAYLSNYKLKVIEGVFVQTKTPIKLFGNGGLVKQRIYSWDYVVLKFVGTYIRILFHGGLFTHLMLKMFILYELWTLFIDFQRVPLFIYVLVNQSINLSIFVASLYFVNLVIILWFNYVTLYEFDVKSDILTIVLFPCYKFLLVIFRLCGELNYIIKYRSTLHRYPTLIENMPELPNILEDTQMDIRQIQWDKIFSDHTYIRNSIMPHSNQLNSLRKKIKIRNDENSEIESIKSDSTSLSVDSSNLSTNKFVNKNSKSNYQMTVDSMETSSNESVQEVFDDLIKMIDEEEKQLRSAKQMEKKMRSETAIYEQKKNQKNKKNHESNELSEIIVV
jgi:hypothetical protein